MIFKKHSYAMCTPINGDHCVRAMYKGAGNETVPTLQNGRARASRCQALVSKRWPLTSSTCTDCAWTHIIDVIPPGYFSH
jgi:hypothetical protein